MNHLPSVLWRYRWGIAAVFILALTSYSTLLSNRLLVGDDWKVFNDGMNHAYWFLMIGRFGNVLLWSLFMEGGFAEPAMLVILITAVCLSTALILNSFRITSTYCFTIYASLVLLTPTLTENLLFKTNILGVAFGFLLATISYYFFATESSWIGSYVCLVLALSIHQAFALVFLTLLLAWLVQFSVNSKRTELFRVTSRAAVIFIASVLSWYAMAWLVRHFLGIVPVPADNPYATRLVHDFQGLATSGKKFLSYFSTFMFRDQYLWDMRAKLSFLLILLIGIISLARITSKALTYIFLALMLIAPWSLGIIREVGSYRYTALLGLTVIYPSIFLLTYKYSSVYAKRFLLLPASIIIISFSYAHDTAYKSMLEINKIDEATMAQVASRVDSYRDPTRSLPTRVYIAGKLESDQKKFPFNTRTNTDFPMNGSIGLCGIFNCQTYHIPVLYRRTTNKGLTDIDFRVGSSQLLDEDRYLMDTVQKHFKTNNKSWPHPDSLLALDGRIFIKLGGEGWY